jgi:hypothetical protein
MRREVEIGVMCSQPGNTSAVSSQEKLGRGKAGFFLELSERGTLQ